MSAFLGYPAFPWCARPHPGLGQRLRGQEAAIILRRDEAWGIPVAEVASLCASSALPPNFPNTSSAVFGVSASVRKTQLSAERLSLERRSPKKASVG